MRRGDVIRLDLGTPPGGGGHEQAGIRPVIVVSLADDDPNNPMITVVPSTGKINKNRFPYTLEVNPSTQNGLTTKSVLLAFQVLSYDKRRVIEVIGSLEPEYMHQLEQKLRQLMNL